ncbi:MAG: NRDE family protein [Woeseiaceae bacterium]|nr:NRDE family protein [Woeseiaceae bacterium]
MCLIVFAWQSHPGYRLVLAANRDELHARPTRELHWWPDRPEILAGRDLEAGGTWLAASRLGRFATVTNYREGRPNKVGLKSRGALVTDFVTGDGSPEAFVRQIEDKRYAGFSLLVASGDELWYISNRGDGPVRLAPGIYGLSNAALDTPWSKLVRSRDRLTEVLETSEVDDDALIGILSDREPVLVTDVKDDSLPFELAPTVTAPFIVAPDYGTRCTTVVRWHNDDIVAVTERRFDADGENTGEEMYRFGIGGQDDR